MNLAITNIDKKTALFEAMYTSGNSKKTFFRIEEKEYTYGEVDREVRKIMRLLSDKGLGVGDRVILSTDNDLFTTYFFLAFLRAGIVTVFVDPSTPVNRALPIIKKASSKALVMDKKLFEERKELLEAESFDLCLSIEVQKKKKGKLLGKLLKKKQETNDPTSYPVVVEALSPFDGEEVIIKPQDGAYIIFTSGTTSAPKGVVISHGNLMTHLDTLSQAYKLDQDSRILNILMLYHADGIIQGPILSLFNACTWYRPFRFDLSRVQELFDSIYRLKISHFITVPTMLSFMEKLSEGYEDSFDTEDFKGMISVAALLEPQLWESVESLFKVHITNVYGLTETVAGSLFCIRNKDQQQRIGTVGKPLDCEVKVLTEGIETKVGEKGVLYLRGEHLFKEYFSEPEMTEKAFEEDGWFATGDVVEWDEEGHLTIVGRVKNTISFGGFNIYPEQITEVVNAHSDVEESVTLGVDDDVFGEKIVVAVAMKEGRRGDKNELLAYLRDRLEPIQMPKEVHFFDSLPKGLTGKVSLPEVYEMIALLKENDSFSENQSLSHGVKQVASKAFGVKLESIKMRDNSATLEGWDSMAHLQFITDLEKQYNVQFSTAEMITVNSLQAVERVLKEKLEN